MGIMTGALVAGVAGSAISANAQSDAASSAANAQTAASNAEIAAQERALAETRELLSPYVQAGDSALAGQLDLLGLNGFDTQQTAVDNISNDPLFLAQVQQGEDAMLQNASATGGLRGGNIQGALAQYRPQMLNQEIQQRLGNLGGLAGLGQASAAGVGAAAQNTAGNIGTAYGNIGAAQAGSALASGQATANMASGITNNLSQYAMMSNLGLLGGSTSGGVNWSAF